MFCIVLWSIFFCNKLTPLLLEPTTYMYFRHRQYLKTVTFNLRWGYQRKSLYRQLKTVQLIHVQNIAKSTQIIITKRDNIIYSTCQEVGVLILNYSKSAGIKYFQFWITQEKMFVTCTRSDNVRSVINFYHSRIF